MVRTTLYTIHGAGHVEVAPLPPDETIVVAIKPEASDA
jgi:hypothetical protein